MAYTSIGSGRRSLDLALLASLCVASGCASEGRGRSGGGGEGGESGSGASGPGTTGPGSASASASASGAGGAGGAGGSAGGGGCGKDVEAPEEILPGTTDPAGGVFTMADALAELPEGPGPLRAVIETELGTLTCELFSDKAPNGVANFVGLARGRRPWKDPVSKKWVKRRFYDGLLFHRVDDDFVIQGGDPLGTGFGGPGYKFADEISNKGHVAGTLAYANSGPNTNGSQFYITETPQPALDGGYTVFGLCSPQDVISTLAAVPTGANEKPVTDIHMLTVTITRCAP